MGHLSPRIFCPTILATDIGLPIAQEDWVKKAIFWTQFSLISLFWCIS